MEQLPKIIVKTKKRVGRGYGSGRGGHTAGRGTKGQKSRSKVGIMFEGTKFKKSFVKRLPFKRGKDKFKPKAKPTTLNLSDLNTLPVGTVVTVESLIKHGLINPKTLSKNGVKILGNGEITKKLTVTLPLTNSASQKVTKAGGSVE